MKKSEQASKRRESEEKFLHTLKKNKIKLSSASWKENFSFFFNPQIFHIMFVSSLRLEDFFSA